jgi:hypothetical protein
MPSHCPIYAKSIFSGMQQQPKRGDRGWAQNEKQQIMLRQMGVS